MPVDAKLDPDELLPATTLQKGYVRSNFVA